MSFSDDAARVLASAGLVTESPSAASSRQDKAAMRRMALAAYERANQARGIPADRTRIFASAIPWLYGDGGE